jgi:oligoendopeptidase F
MATATAKEAYVPDATRKRDLVPNEFKWDISPWYKDVPAWEAALTAIEARIAGIGAFRGKVGASAADLRGALDTFNSVLKDVDRLINFAQSDFSVDRTIDAAKARSDRAQAIASRLAEAASFIEPEILALDAATLTGYRAAEKGLDVYGHYLDDLLRRKAHVLTPQLESQLALSGDLRAGPYSMVNALHQDIQFPTVQDEDGAEKPLTMASFARYRGSKDRAVRKAAVGAFFGTLQKYGRSLAASLDMGMKADILVAKTRGYGSALEASLDVNAVPVAVYDNLLASIHEALPRTLHRYVALRKKILKLDEIHYYDLYNPLVPSVERNVPYEKGVELIRESLKPLGKAYLDVAVKGMTPGSGWTDIYPNDGKRSGAYCTAVYGEHPFVFLNYMDQLDDVFTTAHEYGHALHFHLTNSTQPYATANTPIFLAEIASTFNENMLLTHLLKQARGKDERLALLNKRLESIRTTVFRQVMFAEFERALHAEVEGGGALTAERINQLYGDLVKTFYGPDYAFDPSDAIEWSYVPHFYYNFYVYQYATGLMSAIALSQKVIRGDQGAVDSFLAFLKAGASDYPIETLKKAGVDFTTSAPIDEAMKLFEETLDQIERAWNE